MTFVTTYIIFGQVELEAEDAMKERILLSALTLLVIAPALFAQAIHIRTVPVIASNQSDFQPSLARGMGNLSIAFDDPLGDPFINPAKAYRLMGVTIFSSPTRNSWSNEDGRPVTTTLGSSSYPGASISSIPFGGYFSSGKIFGGGLVAYQGYNAKRSSPNVWWDPLSLQKPTMRTDLGTNTYIFGMFGYRFPNSNVSIAASVSWGDFGAMDGVNLLYPGSYDIKQNGWAREYKLGILGELTERDQLEFVVARTLLRARHEVTYPLPIRFAEDRVTPLPMSYRTEINRDESNGWIMHGGYTRLLGQGWRIGGMLAVNWKDHPKIPNYALANIPRDPGTSIAYNIGFGVAQNGQRSTWGFEYVYEPITSNTWAEAGEGVNPGPSPLPANFKTVENFFDFSNHIFRIGLHSKTNLDWLDYRLGAQLHFYKYDLNQNDNIRRTSRSFEQDWAETTLTGGLNVRFSNVQLMYTLQLILGNGMVGTVGGWVATRTASGDFALEKDFLVAPSGKLLVDKIPLITQQITFVFKLE